MLILSRKKAQRIFVDAPRSGRIEIVLLSIGGGTARIGLNAPMDFKIEREEIAQRNSNTSTDHCHAG
jgi:carbon storage regulator CsrA